MPQQCPIMVVGGHVTPAYATIESLKSHKFPVIFIGREVADSHGSPSKERKLMSELKVSFETLTAPKLYRYQIYRNLWQLPKLVKSLSQAFSLVNKHQPAVLLSFGGYLSLPLAVAALVQRIPIVVHEQTTVMGLSNRLVSLIATHVATSWEYVSKAPSQVIMTGNPIRKAFFSSLTKPMWFHRKSAKPLVYITGGNQGAKSINQAIARHLADLLDSYQIVHQTGDARGCEDLKSLQAIQENLDPLLQEAYSPKAWFDGAEVAWFMEHADVVVSRAGANTCVELLLKQSQCILIPLPIAGGNEQLYNAKALEKFGLATVVPQSQIDDVPKILTSLVQKPKKVSPKLAYYQTLHRGAAEKLAQLVISCVETK